MILDNRHIATSNQQRNLTPTVNNRYPTTDTWQPATNDSERQPTPTVNNRYPITETWQPAIKNSERQPTLIQVVNNRYPQSINGNQQLTIGNGSQRRQSTTVTDRTTTNDEKQRHTTLQLHLSQS
jgi:hypothetical protein